MQKLKYILFGTGSLLTIGYLFGMQKTVQNLEAVITAKVHSLTFGGITLRVDAILKNPSKDSLKIKFPFVRILYKGVSIGTSQVENKEIPIPAFGQASIENIKIQIPLFGILGLILDFINLLKKGETIKIEVHVLTTAYTVAGAIPYTYKVTQDIKL